MNIFKQRGVVIAIIIVLVVVALLVWMLGGSGGALQGKDVEVSLDDPVTTVLDFYEPWLDARRSTSTDPYKEGLADATILSKELRASLKEAKGQLKDGIDPVLCQPVVPDQLATRPVFEHEDKAEVLITSRDKARTEQAIITLLSQDGGWYIDSIKCTLGEFAPEREFSFEMEGFLLKSVPAPYNPDFWHLVFEVEGVPGHVAPLFFDGESVCADLKGKESVCSPNNFVETTKVFVQAQMTESGAEVKKMEVVEEAEK